MRLIPTNVRSGPETNDRLMQGTRTDGLFDLAPGPPSKIFFSGAQDTLSFGRDDDRTFWTVISRFTARNGDKA